MSGENALLAACLCVCVVHAVQAAIFSVAAVERAVCGHVQNIGGHFALAPIGPLKGINNYPNKLTVINFL